MQKHIHKTERPNSRAVANRVIAPAVQRKSPLEEEEPLQGKFQTAQRVSMPEEEELLQGKFEHPIQRKPNRTGLTDTLKSGIENLSGIGMDDVKVHYNSAKPSQLQAHAYTQGTDIHVAPGQEKHLPHEAWHVVQQKQGRVRPTVQMKGKVNINDDKGLEQEADVMGNKALQFKSTFDNPIDTNRSINNKGIVQRAIIIGGQNIAIITVFEHLRTVKKKWIEEDMLTNVIFDGILPAYDAMNKNVDTIENLIEQMSKIIYYYQALYQCNRFETLSEYLTSQKKVQDHVKTNKNLYKGLVTTVGFEHEFTDMKDSPIAGVSHMEIAESTEGMPYTDIKFLVETDAANALELVSPPFLFPTVKGSTVPKGDAVNGIDKLMKWALVTILTEKNWGWGPDIFKNRKYVDQTLQEMLVKLNTVTGFTFNLNKNIEILPGYLSHKTDLNKLKDHVNYSNDKITLKQDSLTGIKVGGSIKGEGEEYQISSQVNFATDMQVASKLNSKQGVDDPHADVFRHIQAGLSNILKIPDNCSQGLTGFYPIMIGKLASLFAVYSQKYVRKNQGDLYSGLVNSKKDVNHGQNQVLLDQKAKDEFNLHALLMSYVKDITPIWIKDHLLSIARGMLVEKDWPVLLKILENADNDLNGFVCPQGVAELFKQSSHTNLQGHWENFKVLLKDAIVTLKNVNIELEVAPNVDLYGHQEGLIGARQDTYQNPERIQMPEIHPGKRLHVAEIRRGNPSDRLKELEKDL